jgi:aminoglycoside phosphotransferase family enzyme/predicted kinase
MAAALELHEELISALLQPEAYPEPVERVDRIDTHISTVLLAGPHAYKIKKPVAFGFLDYSTLEQRHAGCIDEVRLNRRTAPQIYLDVVPIVSARGTPRIGEADPAGDSQPIEYAVRMRRFDHDLTLDRLAGRRQLTARHIDRLAAAVARLHQAASVAPAGYGTPEVVNRWVDGNFESLRDRIQSAGERARLDALREWSVGEWRALTPRIEARIEAGRVRECHGDLHLGNVVALDGEPVLFDAIEFKAELRMIDVASDIAFTFMDLADYGESQFAWRFVNAYCEHTGDYEALALLRFYAVYRALVRAHVALIRLQQPQLAHKERLREHTSFEHYLALAERLHRPATAALVVMTGLSGSGKSMVALRLAERTGGVRVRSDVERKRLFGLAPDAASNGRIYTADATVRTYARLADMARLIIGARVPAIIDAAFLKRAERSRLHLLAAELGVPFALVECQAPLDQLRKRVAARAAAHQDPSEADVSVLERQIAWREPLSDDEQSLATVVETGSGDWEQCVDAWAARLLRERQG